MNNWLAHKLSSYAQDPLGYVRFAFSIEPTQEERDFLEVWGKQIRERAFDGKHPVAPIQLGQSYSNPRLAAWVTKFILDTRAFSKGVFIGDVEWRELGKWHLRSPTVDWFKMSLRGLTHVRHEPLWGVYKQSATADAECFAGFMSWQSTIFFVFNDVKNIPIAPFEVRQAAMHDGEPMTFDFGLV